MCCTGVLLCDVCRFCCYCCCGCCFFVCLCFLARVGVLCHRRGMALGHACGMPPTGANIAVLVLKTELAAASSYTSQLAVVGFGVGMMVVWVPYYCCAAVCCSSLPLLLLLLLFCFGMSVCFRVLVCSVIVEARRSVTRVGCRPPAPTLLCYY